MSSDTLLYSSQYNYSTMAFPIFLALYPDSITADQQDKADQPTHSKSIAYELAGRQDPSHNFQDLRSATRARKPKWTRQPKWNGSCGVSRDEIQALEPARPQRSQAVRLQQVQGWLTNPLVSRSGRVDPKRVDRKRGSRVYAARASMAKVRKHERVHDLRIDEDVEDLIDLADSSTCKACGGTDLIACEMLSCSTWLRPGFNTALQWVGDDGEVSGRGEYDRSCNRNLLNNNVLASDAWCWNSGDECRWGGIWWRDCQFHGLSSGGGSEGDYYRLMGGEQVIDTDSDPRSWGLSGNEWELLFLSDEEVSEAWDLIADPERQVARSESGSDWSMV